MARYSKIMLRRRFCKRFVLTSVSLTIALILYLTVYLLGDLKMPRVMQLTDLSRCPACYGISVCPELYSGQITLETRSHWADYYFNAKNVFYGSTKSDRKVVLKKLAHDWELSRFDKKMCRQWHLEKKCKPIDLLNVSNIEDKIVKLVEYNFSSFDPKPREGLVLCPYAHSVYELIQPIVGSKKSSLRSDMLNIWTILSINPEPIILQILPKSKGWPVPAYGGVCGRLEVVGYEGEALSAVSGLSWYKKLKFAKKILEAAMDFTFKHDKYRFYLMDWSLDNIVANENDDITFVDLEDIIVLDKHISPQKDLPNWYQRYHREALGTSFTFSIDSICKHHLSDHNLWAACYVLAGDDNPLLYPLPADINTLRPHLNVILKECLTKEDTFRTMPKLQHVVTEMLLDKQVMSVAKNSY